MERDQAGPSVRRPRGERTRGRSWGSDRSGVADAGAVAAPGEEAGRADEVDQAAADRRDPVAGPDRGAVAGCAGSVRDLATRVRVVPGLAAGRGVGADP